MSWWQKKLLRYGLRYGLARTGLLEDDALDLDNLDITIGKSNVIELKDVGLNIQRITKLAQLPTCLRLETARILLLRLIIPADFYQSNIVVEVEGVDICVRLEGEQGLTQPESTLRSRSPLTTRTPQHRKTNRRIPSPSHAARRTSIEPDEDLHVPTTEEVAKSFLRDEPLQERQKLEAEAASDQHMGASIVSESSDDDVGTGMSVGVPGFLSKFLQGIVDRFKLHVKNVQVKICTEIDGDMGERMPVNLVLKVAAAQMDPLEDPAEQGKITPSRSIALEDVSVALLSEATVFSSLSAIPRMTSRAASKSSTESHRHVHDVELHPHREPSATSTTRAPLFMEVRSEEDLIERSQSMVSPLSADGHIRHTGEPASIVGHDHPLDNRRDLDKDPETQPFDLAIRPGDDNASWGSRRKYSDAPVDHLWQSMVSEDSLPDSLLIETAEPPALKATFSSYNDNIEEREALSLHDRGFASPESWPRLNPSPNRYGLRQSPGSWPLLGHNQHSACDQSDHVPQQSQAEVTENERDADDLAGVERHQIQAPKSRAEDMIESQSEDYEEAQSMYMSAVTGSRDMAVPGGWESEGQALLCNTAQGPTSNYTTALDGNLSSSTLGLGRHDSSENITPRAKSPNVGDDTRRLISTSQMIEKIILVCDATTIRFPFLSSSSNTGVVQNRHGPEYSPVTSHAAQNIPGTFSAYSEISSSRWKVPSSAYDDTRSAVFSASGVPLDRTDETASLDISIESVKAQIDTPTGRLLHALLSQVPIPQADSTENSRNPPATATSDGPSISVRLQMLQLLLYERLPTSSTSLVRDEADKVLASIRLERLEVLHAIESSVRIGSLGVFLCETEFLAFKHDHAGVHSEALAFSEGDPALLLQLSRHRVAVDNRPIIDAKLQTATLHLNIDLVAMDDAFEGSGGLSGMLELGNSILSESQMASPMSSGPPKGVRFVDDLASPPLGPELKFNARVAGCVVWLRTQPCSLKLLTSTLKTVYREQGAVMSTEHVALSGPLPAQGNAEAPLALDLASVRIEYFSTPQDRDLGRLLSLLTPSKDKYDNDNDILIDTLLRQRRKGSLLRVAVSEVKVRVDELSCFHTLGALGDDLSKFSVVAKYLPEDEKPGLLSLIRIRDASVRLPIKQQFGKFQLSLSDLHLAHVGLPALLAFSVGSVNADQVDGLKMLHPLLPLTATENLPVVMARMLGDEEEPLMKIKIFNLCLEYSVPTILTLFGSDGDTNVDLANSMVQSMAGLTLSNEPTLQRSPDSNLSKTSSKHTRLSLQVHDSGICLTPLQQSSRAFVLLSDFHASTSIPPDGTVAASLALRKASLLITDHVIEQTHEISNPTGFSSSPLRVVNSLIRQGYVSVGSIMSATIDFRAREGSNVDAKVLEVDVRNELLLLETCADSTQTLITTLSALVPPSPPNKEPKYLSEPVLIEDLLKSFSGETIPVQEPETSAQVLFDADDSLLPDESADISVENSFLDDEPDEILAESALAGSLYGPVSEVFGLPDDNEHESTMDEFPETAESLLEEDPFEMTMAPDERLSDAALMRDLNHQRRPANDQRPVDLGLYEIQDLGYDAPGISQKARGDHYRFTVSNVRQDVSAKKEQIDVPFRLRVRDFHAIWHLHDGFDWQRTRNGIVEAVEEVERRAEERQAQRRHLRNDFEEDESVIGDFLFNSIYIGVPTGQDAQDLRRQINRGIDEDVSETASIPVSASTRPTVHSASGPTQPRHRKRLKLGRSKSHKIAFELRGVSADVLVFPPGQGEIVSSVDIRVKDFEIFDKVPTSTWRKFLTHMTNDASAREMSKPMFHVQMETVKTIESHAATEVRLHVTVLPLRLHVDQDALDFITRFFEFKDAASASSELEGDKPYIQRIEVDTVDLCLDYKPKKVDYVGLRSGKTTEFMNFVTLEGANIRLRHAIAYGIQGFDQLHPRLNGIWMPDIQRNQLPTILAGLAPVRSLVNLGTGIRDVIAVPVAEYRQNGRIVRSIRAGGVLFGKTTTSELARLGAKVALGTHTLLTSAEQMLSPSAAATVARSASRASSARRTWSAEHPHDVSSASDDEEPEQKVISAYANQPIGLLSGLRSARRLLEHDLLTARDALIAVQGEFLESRGPGDVAGTVVRHAPTVLLRPVIGATRAVGTSLLGIGNQIDRENLRKVEDKYKRR